MKKLALGALCIGLLAACGGNDDNPHKITLDSGPGTDGGGQCNPLTQAGCGAGQKCSWVIDATDPQYVGHTACVQDGTKAIGDACTFGAAGSTGFDDCKAGGVCSGFGMPGQQGTCKAVCDNAGGQPMCDATHVCVTYSDLFETGATSPPAAGVCDHACDPLTDNDFDGSGSASANTGHTCGSDARIGCYGFPSEGSPPATGWSCTGDVNSDPDLNLRYRTRCTPDNGCAPGGTIYINSCNQGYIPLFYESSTNMTVTCTALCAPLPCYAGNCGSNNANQQGAFPHRCKVPDIVYGVDSLAPAPAHEHCEYLWDEELDMDGNWLQSPTSDTVGVCFDHSKWRYDGDMDGSDESTYPDCKDLQIFGSGSDPTVPNDYWGAANFGCVDSTTAMGSGSAQGKRMLTRKTGFQMDRPRFLYHRMAAHN